MKRQQGNLPQPTLGDGDMAVGTQVILEAKPGREEQISSSYLLRGSGNPDSLWSASHGAGRKKSRGDAIRGNDKAFRQFMDKFHIITPIDPDRSAYNP